MNITAIICEYNPFHLGHRYHLEKARLDTKADGIICIMSGNYMQRGVPAMIDKFKRAELAALNGVDLVIELPLIHSISSAEGFSTGAVTILNNTNVVNNLYFGSESDDFRELKYIASIFCGDSGEYKAILKENLKLGLPFHKSRELALQKLYPNILDNKILSSSNNILAIEYLKALIKLKSNMTPFSLTRRGADYNDKNINSIFPSATAIRENIKNTDDILFFKNSLPDESFNFLKKLKSTNYHMTFPEEMFPFLKYKILTEGHFLSKLPLVTEGLDNKIVKEALKSNSFDELILNIKSKRYTYTRISRILTSFFIGLENYDLNDIKGSSSEYIRPLAFNSKGAEILKEIKRKGNLDIITKLPKKISNSSLELDILGTKSYSVINTSVSANSDYLISPYFQK